MIRLVAVIFARPSRHRRWPCRLPRSISLRVPLHKSAKAAVPLGYESMVSAWREPASVRLADTTAGVLDGVEVFAFRTTEPEKGPGEHRAVALTTQRGMLRSLRWRTPRY